MRETVRIVSDGEELVLSEGEAFSALADARARVAVIVWDGKPRDADDLTQQFQQEAVARGWDVREVLSLAKVP